MPFSRHVLLLMSDPILVTGGSSGLGASLVDHLAGDYQVVTVARRIDRLTRLYGDDPAVHPHELDLADPEAVETFLDNLLEEWGYVPYLVNCAGSWTPKPVTELTQADLLRAMQVDAFSYVHTMAALLPAMREQDFGRIVNVGGSGALVPSSGWATQYASTMARHAYTVSAALENDDRDIKVNLLGPGPMATEMYDGPLSPRASHPTVEYLLNLDADGPTGRFFWLGYELPLFPDLGETDLFETFEADDSVAQQVAPRPDDMYAADAE